MKAKVVSRGEMGGQLNLQSQDRIYMSTDKNETALLSVIYNLQSCKIALRIKI